MPVYNSPIDPEKMARLEELARKQGLTTEEFLRKILAGIDDYDRNLVAVTEAVLRAAHNN